MRELGAGYIIFYILAGFSMTGSIYVIATILRYGSQKSCFTFLLLYFHISMFGQEIVTLPYTYNSVANLCVAMQFFHFYFGLMNIILVGLLVEAHRGTIFDENKETVMFIKNNGIYFFLGIPMITVLPFITSSYDITDDVYGFCTLPYQLSSAWALGIYYAWVWVILFYCIGVSTYGTIKIYRKDKVLGKMFLSTIGLYTVIAILLWIPRSLERAAQINSKVPNAQSYFTSYFPINISGILCTLIFLRKRKSLKNFSDGDNDRMTFLWEKNDLLDIIGPDQSSRKSSMSTTSISVNPFGDMFFGLNTVLRTTSFAGTNPPPITNPVFANSTIYDDNDKDYKLDESS
jgi:hypothetical protein